MTLCPVLFLELRDQLLIGLFGGLRGGNFDFGRARQCLTSARATAIDAVLMTFSPMVFDVGEASLGYSARMPASRTTLVHLGISSRISCANSAGVLATISNPTFAMRSFDSGSFMMRMTSA